MDNPRSNPPDTPPTDEQRALEHAAQRSLRAAQGLIVAAVLVPFIAFHGFHLSRPAAVLLHLGFLVLTLRQVWIWWGCRRALARSSGPAGTLPGPATLRKNRGSYPSRKVRVIDANDTDLWAQTVQRITWDGLLGSYDNRPVYQWVRLDDRWYRYETVDALAEPITDPAFHLVLGGLRYLQMPDDHAGPAHAPEDDRPSPLSTGGAKR